MDNNQNNNSGSSYSYNFTNNQNENNIWRASDNQANYQSNQQNQTNAGNTSENTSWNNATYNGYEDPKKGKKREKKASKPKNSGSGFGRKLAKCAAIALVFGLVGGSVFTGTNYVLGKSIGTNTSTIKQSTGTSDNSKDSGASLTQSSNQAVGSTSVSNATVVSDVSDIVTQVMPSIVAITNMSETQYQSFFGQTGTYESQSCGSGIIVSQDDQYLYIATNNHVVEGANTLTVQFIDDTTVSAEVKGTDTTSDLAVIEVPISGMQSDTLSQIKVATLGNSDDLKVGEGAIAIGNALGYGQSVTTGVISALNRSVSIQDESTGEPITNELIQTDAAINPGNSGGALLNMNGEVIGINEVKYTETAVEGMGYSIPMATASPIIEELINRQAVDASNQAYLGINGVNVSSQIASAYKMPEGIYVAQVVSGSPADTAGILQGDIITKFDGKDVKTMAQLENVIAYYTAGTQVDVVVQRTSGGQYTEQTVKVTLGNKN